MRVENATNERSLLSARNFIIVVFVEKVRRITAIVNGSLHNGTVKINSICLLPARALRTLASMDYYTKPAGVPEHLSAGGIIAVRAGSRVLISLIREGKRDKYVIPKGHVEDGETIEEAARREIEEETGLRRFTLAGYLGSRERLDFKGRSWKITHYYVYTAPEPTSSRAGEYVTEWFPLDELPPMFWSEQRELLETERETIAGLASHQSLT